MRIGHWAGAVNNFMGRRTWLLGIIVVVMVTIGLTVGMLRLWADPGFNLLVKEGGAEWIRFPKPFRLSIHFSENLSSSFRCNLDVREIPEKSVLTFRAMKKAVVYLDGQPIFRTSEDLERWKVPYRLDLAPWLKTGKHELRIDVSNLNGHPALLAYSELLDIFSGESWEASSDDHKWVPALPVDQISHLPISRQFPRSDQAIRSLSPLLLSIFFLFFFWTLWSDNHLAPAWFTRAHLSVSTVRWLLLACWLLMAVNNFWKLPLEMGMDAKGHLQYITYLFETGRIPLATEGWQMFQSPLYYLLAAAVYQLFLSFFNAETVIRIVKLLSFICGMIQVEICYRTLKNAYPGKESLQVIGTLLGGLLPMNLYMSQSLGNEPLVGCLTALLILIACLVFSGVRKATRETAILMGFILGLALLTKVTAILIVPPLLFFVSADILKSSDSPNEGIRSVARFVIITLAISLTVAGWYYLRNWIEMGRFFAMGSFFVGGRDGIRDIVWWQDPGYRTLQQFYRFGEALLYPFYSSIHGFWDSIYSFFWTDGHLSAYNRPPWNYRFMLSGVWLSLLPSAAILIGLVATARSKGEPLCRMLRFSAFSIVFYLTAIFYMFLTVPILSSAKATYALGLIPCFALVGTAGFEILARQRYVRAGIYGLFACWAVCSYLSYFAI
ncbi:MAG: glycosyltransferase family 39 protein [Syntrophales bacterium]